MTAKSILDEIKSLGRASYKSVLLKHGVEEPCYGVKISDLKLIQKRTGKDYALAKALFETGVYDAMYLAGLMADDKKMTPADLQDWAEKAYGPISSSTVPWVAAQSDHGWGKALEWIESSREMVAAAGWGTLSAWVALKEDTQLDMARLKSFLKRVETSIEEAPNEVRYQMNGFIIAVGCHVAELTEMARSVGTRVGEVTVDMGDTSCQVPFAPDYIKKVEKRGGIGKKRKPVKC